MFTRFHIYFLQQQFGCTIMQVDGMFLYKQEVLYIILVCMTLGRHSGIPTLGQLGKLGPVCPARGDRESYPYQVPLFCFWVPSMDGATIASMCIWAAQIQFGCGEPLRGYVVSRGLLPKVANCAPACLAWGPRIRPAIVRFPLQAYARSQGRPVEPRKGTSN